MTPSLDEVRASLEAACAEDCIFRVYGPVGKYIVWATDPVTAMSVYSRRTTASARDFAKLEWQWLDQNMRPYELVELAREGIVRQR